MTKDSPEPSGASPQDLVRCGCGVQEAIEARREGRLIDGEAKAATLRRLARIAGQVRGLHGMIDENRYCADVLTQISSVHEALRAVGRELMRNHLKHLVETARRADPRVAEAAHEEAIDLLYRLGR